MLIPLTLSSIAAYVPFSFLCNFHYIGGITYVEDENRTEAGFAVCPAIGRPADFPER